MCGLPYGPPSLFSVDTFLSTPLGVMGAFVLLVLVGIGVALFVAMSKNPNLTPEDRAAWRRFPIWYASILSGPALLFLGQAYFLALDHWESDQIIILTIQSRLNSDCTVDPAFVAHQEAAVNQATVVSGVLTVLGLIIIMIFVVALTKFLIASRSSERRQARRDALSGDDV